ncbi:glycoside hydrolase family 108 protein [Sphingobium abikonense]|uniref:glycoside hydrolase family 108 protein n=1 Tax=Sphingobium abikonense TaxID=86193 RepID=UPI0035152930
MAQLSTRVAGGGLTVAVLAIIASIFNVEGGYVNNPRDPGGATNHGVTEKVARAHGYAGPMASLPKDVARQIYFDDYVKAPGFDRLIELSEPVGEEAVDSGVNAGPAQPSRWLQIALNSLNRQGRDYPELKVDGRAGAKTMAAFAALQKLRGRPEACRMVLKLMDAQQAAHYLRLTEGNSTFETFMPGWITNRIGNVPLEKCA